MNGICTFAISCAGGRARWMACDDPEESIVYLVTERRERILRCQLWLACCYWW
jgi:hypothetical protein